MKEQKTSFKFNVMAILLIIIFCCAISPKTLQNDTFYTIEIGEYLVENGLTMEDPFSWHENLKYTFPHWAYDVMIYFIYSLGGQLGIYISTMALCSVLGVLSYLTCKKLNKNALFSFVFTIVGMYLMKDYIAARAQLVTFILFVLTINFIESFLQTRKKRYAIGLIIIPILIANLHAATFYFYFILYLPYIGEYFITLLSNYPVWRKNRKIKNIKKKIDKTTDENEIESLKAEIAKIEEKIKKEEAQKEKRKAKAYKITVNRNENVKYLILIMIICLFTGLLTPQDTFEPYTHLVKLMQGNSTEKISEHLPLTLINNIELMCLLVFVVAILMFTDTKIRLCDLFMLGGLIFLTFWSRRQASMLIIICLPIFVRLVCAFVNKYAPDITQKAEKAMVTFLGVFITTGIILIFSLLNYKNKVNSKFISTTAYPVEASEWILENLDVNEIRLYNEYNYGSYLLFKGIPVFIDSRCDLYTPEFNEGRDIFNDFLTMFYVSSMNMESKFDKYDFTHLILDKDSKLNIYLKSNSHIYNQIYKDDNFVIYERNA